MAIIGAILGIISAAAATVAVVAGVGSIVAAATGHQSTAETLGAISLIASGISLGTGLASMGISSILKANTMLIDGSLLASSYTGEAIELPMIVIYANPEPTMSMGWQAQAVAFAHKMASTSIITSGVAGGNVAISTMLQVSGLYDLALQIGNTAAHGYSHTFGGNYAFTSSSHNFNPLYGSNFSVKGDSYISAIEFTTSSAYNKGSVAIDKASAYYRGTITEGIGAEAEVAASVIEISSEHNVPWTLGDTAFSIHSSAGWGAKLKGALIVDWKSGSGKAALGGGVGPTGSLEVRWFNANRR